MHQNRIGAAYLLGDHERGKFKIYSVKYRSDYSVFERYV